MRREGLEGGRDGEGKAMKGLEDKRWQGMKGRRSKVHEVNEREGKDVNGEEKGWKVDSEESLEGHNRAKILYTTEECCSCGEKQCSMKEL